MSVSVSNTKESLEKLQHCLMGVSAWMPGSKLKLNPSMTEFISGVISRRESLRRPGPT